MHNDFVTLAKAVDHNEEHLIELQTQLVALPALGPENGGQGEEAKVAFLEKYLAQYTDLTLTRINAPDARVAEGLRPTLIVQRQGQSARTLWLIAHTDVVPPGDLTLWTGDPFILRRDGDRIFGRGVEDNHQGLVSSLLLLRALEEGNIDTELSLGLIFVADEETGNTYGAEYLVRNAPELFKKDDLIIIPDYGEPNGGSIEIAEKSVLWLQFTVTGKQCHASTPQQGVNAMVAASDLVLHLAQLPHFFSDQNPLFSPPVSTFVPSKREANVPNVNTLPGQDVFYLDCRVLPSYPLERIEEAVASLCQKVENAYNVRINTKAVMREEAAPQTEEDAPVVHALQLALRETRQQDPKLIGIGGGTVAAVFRRLGLAAVCWSTLQHTAHQPDEWASVTNTLADAKTLGHVLLHGHQKC